MKRKGDSNEYKRLQDAEIMAAYRRLFHLHGGLVTAKRLYEMVAAFPATRFFVSGLQAARVVKGMGRGATPPRMRAARLRMYMEIMKRAEALRRADPRMRLTAAVAVVVRQPAPEMYISPRQVAAIIGRERRKAFEERRLRLRHTL